VAWDLTAAVLANLGGATVDLRSGDLPVRRLRLPRPSDPRGAGTVALVDARHPPRRTDLDGLGRDLGAAVQVVVLVGPGADRHLGTGDWEDAWPALLVGDDDAVAPLVGGVDGIWRRDLGWGCLGLPVVWSVNEAPLALGRDLHPWRVALEPVATWRIGRHESGRGREFPHLLAACHRHRLPLVVGFGTGAGFVSDPLTLGVDGRPRPAPGGTRYVAAGSGLDLPAGLPADALAGLDGGVVVGLHAEGDRLRLVLSPAAGRPWPLVWEPWPQVAVELSTNSRERAVMQLQRWIRSGREAQRAGRAVAWLPLREFSALADEGRAARDLLERAAVLGLRDILLDHVLSGPDPWPQEGDVSAPSDFGYPWPPEGLAEGGGWGVGDERTLVAAWMDEPARPAAPAEGVVMPVSAGSRLRCLPLPAAIRGLRTAASLEAALDHAAAGEDDLLLRRLLAVNLPVGVHWVAGQAKPPTVAVREVMLRYLEAGHPVSTRDVAAILTTTREPVAVWAAVDRSEGRDGIAVLRLLQDRIEAQVAGRLPLEDDALLQHRVLAAVFGSPYLSPTPLRPLAQALEPRLEGPSAEVLARFFTRHGRHRPVDR